MIAKIPTPNIYNARCYDGKQTVADSALCKPNADGTIATLARVEWYMGRSKNSSVVYCNVWIPGVCSGTGQAGGWGYHKESAAFADALKSAGVELYGSPYSRREDAELTEERRQERAHIGGCGSQSVDEALKAIALCLGYAEPLTII